MAHGVYPILNVADLDRSRAFYKGLGLKVAEDAMPMGPDFTMRWITVTAGDDHAFRLFPREFPGADPEDVAWASGDVGKGVLVNVGVPNAARTHAKAEESGADPAPLEPNPWGGHAFMLRDPDGYYLMVTDKWPTPPKPRKRTGAAAKRGARKGAKKAPAKKAAPKKAAAKKAAKARK